MKLVITNSNHTCMKNYFADDFIKGRDYHEYVTLDILELIGLELMMERFKCDLMLCSNRINLKPLVKTWLEDDVHFDILVVILDDYLD